MKKMLAIAIFFFSLTNFLMAQETEKDSLTVKIHPKQDPAEIAKKLANTVASLISLPFQNNTDVGIGENHEGYNNTLNVQPILPFSLSNKLNLISRYIIPIVSQKNITGKGTSQAGLGDMSISAFFSPSKAKQGFVWGVGPVFLVPTATNEFLGTKNFSIGPTALALLQTHSMTIGALVSQIWSVANADGRVDVNTFILQPFFSYGWKSGATIGISAEVTENWVGDNSTTAYIIPRIGGITKLGTQIVQLKIGPRIQVASPDKNGAVVGIRA